MKIEDLRENPSAMTIDELRSFMDEMGVPKESLITAIDEETVTFEWIGKTGDHEYPQTMTIALEFVYED